MTDCAVHLWKPATVSGALTQAVAAGYVPVVCQICWIPLQVPRTVWERR